MQPCWSDARVEAAARGEEPDASHLALCERCRLAVDERRSELAILNELRAARKGDIAPLVAQTLVRGYAIEGEIHRGGQGIVYRARQEATKRAVALKVPLGGREASARERRRFEREIELASRLDHPGLVRLFDSGPTDETPWYAMELVEGRPLDAWARATDRPLRARVELARRIAAAVAHAHQRGVIHRDLKPANVLVDERDQPRVLDFGAAFAEADAATAVRTTAPGEFLGTLAYAAPEQLRAERRAPDTRTDVYALGGLLYELLTGELPLDVEGGLAAVVERVARQEPRAPSALARGIDRDLDRIVLKALAKVPQERYGSAEELERDLARYLAGEPVEARGHGALYVLGKHLARRRRAVAAAALALAIGGAAAVAWMREHESARRQGELALLANSLIHDLLTAAAPQRMGGDARLLDVYEVIARDLDRELRDAPDVQAAVELAIGETYRKLLRSREAQPHLRKALARLREIDDRRELEIARADDALALALADENDPEAIAVAEEALAIRERELPALDARVAQSRRTLAHALLEQFTDVDVARSRALLDRALSDLRQTTGDDHPDVAETLVLRAKVGADLPPGAVEQMLASALRTLERESDKDPRVLGALCAYASFLQAHERFDEARTHLDRAGLLAQTLFGDALASDLLRRHARLEFARGNAASSEWLSRQAVARELERWAARRQDLADSLRALARRVEQPGAPSAEPPYPEAFAALRALEGDGMFELAQWMNGIALVLRQLGRGQATEPLLREALHIRCRAMGADCPVRRKSIELLADELVAERRGGEAIELLEEALASFERADEAESDEAFRARDLLARSRAQLVAAEQGR